MLACLGTESWTPPASTPEFDENGYLASFGGDAMRLLHEHFANRLHVVFSPEARSMFGATFNVHPTLSSSALEWGAEQGGFAAGLGMFTGDKGIMRGAARLSQLGATLFCKGEARLNQDGSGRTMPEKHAIAGVAVDQPGITGHVYATVRDSLQLTPDITGCVRLKHGALQVGLQARQSNTTDDDDAAATHLKESSLKLVYSANSWDSAQGRPESYQVALDVQDLGERVSASYFHHSKHRIRNIGTTPSKVYWSNMCYGAELVRSNSAEDADKYSATAGLSWQPTMHSVVKARVSSSGLAQAVAGCRLLDAHEALPNATMCLLVGTDWRTWTPTLGCSFALNVDAAMGY